MTGNSRTRLRIDSNTMRRLYVFLKIAECGGISAAQGVLNKSLSAMSTDLKDLEAWCGCQLCTRGRSGFALTKQGELIVSAAKQFFFDMGKFEDHIALIASQLSGEFSIYMDDSMLYGFKEKFQLLFSSFFAKNPNLYISLKTSSPDFVMNGVLEGDADVGITALPRRIQALEIYPLFNEEMALYCSAWHPDIDNLRDASADSKAVLSQRHIDVVNKENEKVREFHSGVHIRADASSDNSRLLLILSGHLVGFLPVSFASEWERKGDIVRIGGEGLTYSNECFAICRRGGTQEAIKADFIKMVCKAFSTANMPI